MFARQEQTVIAYHKCGFKDQDIALKLNKDIRSIYNANYRIQKRWKIQIYLTSLYIYDKL